MKQNRFAFLIAILVVALLAACGQKEESKMPEETKPVETAAGDSVITDHEAIPAMNQKLAKLATVEIGYDGSGLSENEKKALVKIVQAAKYMDKIFLRQVYKHNTKIHGDLARMSKEHPEKKPLKQYFRINFGPFDRLDADKPFINMDTPKPKGANFYPLNMSKEEFEAHIKANPDDEKAFTSEFTVIRRREGKLVAVPYSEAYKKFLEPAAKLLKEAAQLVENPSVKKYLESRADAFASNDYYQSDIDWVDLKDHKIELVIGPYEVYEDRLFGYKAAFEAFITLNDKDESNKVAELSKYLDEMEKNFPIENKYKNFDRGGSSPIVVANEVYTAGDTKAGVQTIAFNLPNDERVRKTKGSKQVMLKNVCEAKFNKVLVPIAREIMAEADLDKVSFDIFFTHILMHEIAHGLGPGFIEKDGKKTSVGKELKDLYSVIEETKADVLGLYNFQFMLDRGVLDKTLQDYLYTSYLAGIFRSVRFGADSAHGGSNAIQMNYLLEKGGFLYDEASGRYSVNPDIKKVKAVITELSREVLMIEALGDYNGAKAFIAKYRHISPELKKALARAAHVPTDIMPVYAIEEVLK